MEWWQILIIVCVAGIFLEDIVSIIAKTIVIKNTGKDKDESV